MLHGDIDRRGEDGHQDFTLGETGAGGLYDRAGFFEFSIGGHVEPDDVPVFAAGRLYFGKKAFPALEEKFDFFRIHTLSKPVLTGKGKTFS
jgi:hypothetical protein